MRLERGAVPRVRLVPPVPHWTPGPAKEAQEEELPPKNGPHCPTQDMVLATPKAERWSKWDEGTCKSRCGTSKMGEEAPWCWKSALSRSPSQRPFADCFAWYFKHMESVMCWFNVRCDAIVAKNFATGLSLAFRPRGCSDSL